MESDFAKTLKNMVLATADQKLAFANGLLNDICRLQAYIYQVFFEEDGLSSSAFLFALDFSVNYLGIPFILYLNTEEFIIILEKRFQQLQGSEKQNLEWVFERIFYKFVNFLDVDSNLEMVDNLFSLYSKCYEKTQSNFMTKVFNAQNNMLQNTFERKYNEGKSKIKIVLNSIQFDMYEESGKMFQILNSLEINLSDYTNVSERQIMKELIEEKETLMNILKLEVQKTEKPDNKDYIIIDHENDQKKTTKIGYKKPYNTEIPNKEPANNSISKKLHQYTSILFNSHVEFPEDIETEYKDYSFPLGEKQKFILIKTICAFLNTSGGRIYIGIRDQDQKVVGLDLTTKDQDVIRLEIDDLLKKIVPYVEAHECVTHFIPLKASNREKDYIPGCYLIKIIVKRGKVNDLYFSTNGLSYERRFGKCQVFEPQELKRQIIERSKIPETENLKNNEQNKRYLDEEPEKGIPKFMKVPTKSKDKFRELKMKQKEKFKNNNPPANPFPKNVPNEFFQKPTMPMAMPMPATNNKISNIIFVAIPNLNLKEQFQTKFIPFIKQKILEILPKKIKSFFFSIEKLHVYIEAIDQESAFLLREIVLAAKDTYFSQCKVLVDWALLEKYRSFVNSKDCITYNLS